MLFKTGFAALLLAIICLGSYVPESQAKSISVLLENDIISERDTDQNFSHGTVIRYQHDESWGYFIGQNMYTPADLTAEEVITQDRPYGGWLYLGGKRTWQSEKNQVGLELSLGAIGDLSFAEQTQSFVHKITDSTDPKGWDNQLPNEASIQTLGEIHSILYEHKDIGKFQLLADGYLAAGTVRTEIGGGGTVRWGTSYTDFGPDRISVKQSSFLRPDQFFYVFLSLKQKYVVHDLFLDGSLFQDADHTMESEDWVTELESGFKVGTKNWAIGISRIKRTKEFEGQDFDHDWTGIYIEKPF